MALSYLSLACAVLFGIAGQIALKSGAVGAASIAAQLLHPLTIIGFGIYVVAALCYIVALNKLPSLSTTSTHVVSPALAPLFCPCECGV